MDRRADTAEAAAYVEASMAGDTHGERTAGDVVKEIVDQAGELVAGEVALAKDEARQAIGEATASVAVLGVAGLLGFFGLDLLIASLAVANRQRPARLAALGLGML